MMEFLLLEIPGKDLNNNMSSNNMSSSNNNKSGEGSGRKDYLDNIRWATVIIVLIYHVGFIFNGVGVIGGIPGARSIAAFDAFSYIVYPWFMVLLFVVAGMSARYSLGKRSRRQFMKERAVRLLIPSTLGLFVLHWIAGYLNIKMGGGLEFIPSFLVYPISAISGIGPLWFIQMLFLFSLVIALVNKLDKYDRIWKICGKANIWIVVLLFVILWGAAQIGNVPVLTMYRFGIYFTAFLIGYFIFTHDHILDAVEKLRIPMLLAAAAIAAAYVVRYYGSNYTAPQCLQSFLTNLYLWIAILAILGCGKAYFAGTNTFTRYMNRSAWGLYIVHITVLTVTGYILHFHFNLPAIWNYILALAIEFAASLGLYEGLKRIPVVRFLVLGH